MRRICLLYLNNNDPFDEINVTNRMNRNLMKTGLPFESFGKSIYDLMKTGLQFVNRKSQIIESFESDFVFHWWMNAVNGDSNLQRWTEWRLQEDAWRLFGNLITFELCWAGKYRYSVGVKWVKMWHRWYGLTNGAWMLTALILGAFL